MGEQSDTSTHHTSAGRRFLITLRSSAGLAVFAFVVSVGLVGDRVGEALWKSLFVLVVVLLLILAADRINRARQTSDGARAPDESEDEPSR